MAREPATEPTFEELFKLEPVVRKKAADANDIEALRHNVAQGIREQIKTVTHEIDGTEPTPKEARTNKTTGLTVKTRTTKWYRPDGRTEIRYGQQTVFKGPNGAMAFNAGSIEKLPDFYVRMIERINAGTYDTEIRAARARIRGGAGTTPTPDVMEVRKEAAE